MNNQETILIIDDSPVERRMIRSFFESDGFHMLEAHDGIVGLSLAIDNLPDLILLDIAMPGMDGFAVCVELKKNQLTRTIPVIIISSSEEMVVKIEGLEIGAVDYITKPPQRAEVRARVNNHIKINRLTRSLERANRELLYKQKKMDLDLKAAAEIQKNFLPKKLPECPVRFSWHFEPCQKIGGDIFNVYQLNESQLGIYMVDVSGHGVPAAMITALVSQFMSPLNGMVKRRLSSDPYYEIVSPADLMEQLEKEFPFERFNKYFTMIYLILDFKSGAFSYCCAGHPPMILQQADNKIYLCDKGGTVIGLGDISLPLQEGVGRLDSGDRLFLFTDGILEHENVLGKQYGVSRLLKKIEHGGNTMLLLPDAIQYVISDVKAYGGQKILSDDISLLGIEF
jgi:sigma-B regulation protein RsbU (phosphoserine phosphatase)